MKSLSDLTVRDLAEFPVWEFVAGADGSFYVEPVERLPVTDLRNRVVGTTVLLRSGELCWAILGNIDLRNKRCTEHFLTLSVEKGSRWFDLARYHDVDYARRGPEQLGRFLGLPLSSIFPIEYDISGVASAHPGLLKGSVPLEPGEVLPQDKLIQLALEDGER